MSRCFTGEMRLNGTIVACFVCYNDTGHVFTDCRDKSATATMHSSPTVSEKFNLLVFVLAIIATMFIVLNVILLFRKRHCKKSRHIEHGVLYSNNEDDINICNTYASDSESARETTLLRESNGNTEITRHYSLLRTERPKSWKSIRSLKNRCSTETNLSSSSNQSINPRILRKSDSDYESLKSLNNKSLCFDGRKSETDDVMIRPPAANLLDTPWAIQHVVDPSGCSIKLPVFDVSLDFPIGAVTNKQGTYIFGSVHSDIPSLRKTFNISDQNIIVAPVPEFLLKGAAQLGEYAAIVIPHCLKKKSHMIKVQWFQHGYAGNGGITLRDIKKLGRFEDHTKDLDIFYVDQNDGYIRVYTKHFSGILCTSCKKEVNFDLQAKLFSKFGRIDTAMSLTLKMIIGGPLMQLKGFWEETVTRMRSIGFAFIEDGEIDLLPKQNQNTGSVLQFKLELCGESFEKWKHIKRQGTEELIYHEIQTKYLSEMLKCGNEHEVSGNIQWYMKPAVAEVQTGNVTFYIDVTNITHGTADGSPDSKRTTINAEIHIPEDQAAGETSQADYRLNNNTTLSQMRLASALYLMLGRFTSENFKKLVRFLGFPEKARNMEGSEEEKSDYWYETMLDIAENKGREAFPALLCDALQRMGEPLAEEVKSIFLGNPT